MKREYLDALIESYVVHAHKGDDERVAVKDEIVRLCELQRSLGLRDYFARRAA